MEEQDVTTTDPRVGEYILGLGEAGQVPCSQETAVKVEPCRELVPSSFSNVPMVTFKSECLPLFHNSTVANGGCYVIPVLRGPVPIVVKDSRCESELFKTFKFSLPPPENNIPHDSSDVIRQDDSPIYLTCRPIESLLANVPAQEAVLHEQVNSTEINSNEGSQSSGSEKTDVGNGKKYMTFSHRLTEINSSEEKSKRNGEDNPSSNSTDESQSESPPNTKKSKKRKREKVGSVNGTKDDAKDKRRKSKKNCLCDNVSTEAPEVVKKKKTYGKCAKANSKIQDVTERAGVNMQGEEEGMTKDLERTKKKLLNGVLRKKRKKRKLIKLKQEVSALRSAMHVIIDQVRRSPHTEKTVINDVLSKLMSLSTGDEDAACTEVERKKKKRNKESDSSADTVSPLEKNVAVVLGKRRDQESENNSEKCIVESRGESGDSECSQQEKSKNGKKKGIKLRQQKEKSCNLTEKCNVPKPSEEESTEIFLRENKKKKKKKREEKPEENEIEVIRHLFKDVDVTVSTAEAADKDCDKSSQTSKGTLSKFRWKENILAILRSSPHGISFMKLQKKTIIRYCNQRGRMSSNTPAKFLRYLVKIPGVCLTQERTVLLSETVDDGSEESSTRVEGTS